MYNCISVLRNRSRWRRNYFEIPEPELSVLYMYSILTAMMNKNSFLPLLVQIACVLTVIVGVHFKVAMPQH